MNALGLYRRYIGVSMRSQMQYRASFLLMATAYFVVSGVEFLGIWIFFNRFQSIGGWHLAEVALLFGMINIAFAVAEAMSRGFDQFSNMVKSGDFDTVLLRPRSTALQIAGQELQVMRIGAVVQPLIILVWAIGELPATWSAASLILILWSIVGGVCLFYGLFVFQATMTFWTTETLELMNILTYGGTETGKFPLSIYKPQLRWFFTFIIPLACIAYIPSLSILERPEASVWQGWLAPFVGVAFFLVSLVAWNAGVRHYRSTGS